MSKRSKQQAKRRKTKQKRSKQRCLKINTQTATQNKDDNEISIGELKAIIEKTETECLDPEERELLLDVSQTLRLVTEQLEKKNTSIARLRKMLFGASTERLKDLKDKSSDASDDNANSDTNAQAKSDENKPPKKPRKGHGRHSADDYKGGKKIDVAHETHIPGAPCPECLKGTLYDTNEPKRVVRVTGQAPLDATVYALQRLRCGLCGKIFTAQAPKEVGPEKYDAQSVSMIALLKYGTGVPFNRLERLQETLGIPLAASTQWEQLSDREYIFTVMHETLIRQAAQGKVLHNDDTAMRILDRTDLRKLSEDKSKDRNGIFTSGIVSVDDAYQIAVFFTGYQYAGENLSDVLKHRSSELGPPIQMSDALNRNIPGEFETLVSHCLAHGRRRFVDIMTSFPAECRHVLEVLAQVYHHDSLCKQFGYSDEERLLYHQTHSGPLMNALKTNMEDQLCRHQVEDNSGLGEAYHYMLNHWDSLTQFLRIAGAPLDNNICERSLKKAILHRKNAYFYKTAKGSRIGDMFMSLIHTCELNSVNPFEYLTSLQDHSNRVVRSPESWLPWNYQEQVESPVIGLSD